MADDDHSEHHGVSGFGIFIIILIVLIVLGVVGWIAFVLFPLLLPFQLTISHSYTQLRARRLGLPAPRIVPWGRSSNTGGYAAPSPAPGGIQGWFSSKMNALRNTRTAGGAYESTGYSSSSRGRDRRGFGALDPDEAWDTRVGNEADYGGGYYEEQELGLQDPAHGPYGGGAYAPSNNIGVAGIEEGRGRSRSRQRELDERYDEEVHGGGGNPFGDENERSDMSLRGVSPRPMIDTATRGHKAQQSLGAAAEDHSPTERRSMFRENM